jgi:hypothetical protein
MYQCRLWIFFYVKYLFNNISSQYKYYVEYRMIFKFCVYNNYIFLRFLGKSQVFKSFLGNTYVGGYQLEGATSFFNKGLMEG